MTRLGEEEEEWRDVRGDADLDTWRPRHLGSYGTRWETFDTQVGLGIDVPRLQAHGDKERKIIFESGFGC